MTNPNKVKSAENAAGGYDVRVIATGELLATFDSSFLAKRMVQTINAHLKDAK